jgi:uncharacterized protein (UPF0335 family)
MSRKSSIPKVDLETLIQKVETLLETEIDSLPDSLQAVQPEKRLDFVSKILPVVIKYREGHSQDGWNVSDWG